MRGQIQNRHGHTIITEASDTAGARALAFIAHGLHGTKNQAHIETVARALAAAGYVTVRWDATNSTGESSGDMADATATGYYTDLEDVITWAAGEPWYREPFIVCGHSLGGLCSLLFTKKFPQKVFAVAPLGTVVSGALTMRAWEEHDAAALAAWKANGMREWPSATRPGLMKRLKWGFVEDLLSYDVLKDVSVLKKHIVMVVGEDDESTPLQHQQLLFDALPALSKEMHIILGAPHTFIDQAHLSELERIVSGWAKRVVVNAAA